MLGGELVAISSDPASTARGTLKGWRLKFPLIPDSRKKIIHLYGVYNPRTRLAHPTTFIVDRQGKIRWVYRGKNFTDRPAAKLVLEEFRKLATGKLAPPAS